MNFKKNSIVLIFFLMNINFLLAQFPGKRNKKDFIAVDSVAYRVGDILTFGQPMNGDSYASIITFKPKNFWDNLSDTSDALYGNDIKATEFILATKEIKEKKDAKIKFFKAFKSKNGETIHYAIVPYNSSLYLAVSINSSLSLGELNSKNVNFVSSVKIDNDSDDTYVKNFSSDFNIKILVIEGNRNNQTVEIQFLLSHKLVHQEVCFNYGRNDAKLYDLEGNEYLAKSAAVGAIDKIDFGSFVCNKIPANVPVKGKIIFKQVLSDKSKMSFATIKIGYKANDGSNYEYGMIELTNLNIEWK